MADSTQTPATNEKRLDIQIISDNICPFCYLGKKRIEAAVARLPSNVKVTYDWHAFQLDETLPGKSINKMERYQKKFGPRAAGMIEQMKANGKPYGIEFSYGGKIGNTINSHRLVAFSKLPEQGGGKHTDSLINRLFNAYFEREQDIADLSTLAELGVQAGLPATKDEIIQFLQSDRLRAEVLKDVESTRGGGEVTGVPHFTFNQRYSISGAQDPDTFFALFKQMGLA